MTDDQGNKYILGRLEGIREMLMASYKANKAASSNTKGKERESFINLFLSNALPPQFRDKLLLVHQHNGTYTKGWSLWGLIIQLRLLAISLESTSLDLLLYTRTDLMIIKKICNRVNNDKSIEVRFFDFIDEEGIDIQEAEKIFKSLKKEFFIEIVGEESELKEVKLRVTDEAIQFTKFMLTPF